VQAIRQNDDIRIQCVLQIRDDFWLAMSRFRKAVEIPVHFGPNVTMIDLFDLRHPMRGLEEFGRDYGQLKAPPQPLSRDQERFIDGAIKNLTTDRKVIPVRRAVRGNGTTTRLDASHAATVRRNEGRWGSISE
jgi:hypothetical protein